MRDIILSLCDYKGTWSAPYIEKGYIVIRIDPKHSKAVPTEMQDGGLGLKATVQEAEPILSDCGFLARTHGILAAPPCTDFSSSGATHWQRKDLDGTTESSIEIVKSCLSIIKNASPAFWALENPVGRISKLIPELGKPHLVFDPYEYAGWSSHIVWEAYTKKTQLWGKFNKELKKNPIPPTPVDGKKGGWMHLKLGGKTEKTKELRSTTPLGFALAFAEANP